MRLVHDLSLQVSDHFKEFHPAKLSAGLPRSIEILQCGRGRLLRGNDPRCARHLPSSSGSAGWPGADAAVPRAECTVQLTAAHTALVALPLNRVEHEDRLQAQEPWDTVAPLKVFMIVVIKL